MTFEAAKHGFGLLITLIVATPSLNLTAFERTQQRHCADKRVAFDHRAKHRLIMPGQALDRLRFEQFPRIAQFHRQRPVALLARIEQQFELRHLRRQRIRFDLQRRQTLQHAPVAPLMIEHHLKQRRVREAALGTQRIDERIERQILMRLSAQRRVAHLRE
ncbi:hypothetical protein NOV72_06230 [Caballeronia novacaledonica]|uniref:Uncharacterized protein n=1 Tax=Caballeronia novacaledonica TaxID=1544861 RepID=A0A2U3IFK5_9BURK|nr:hypothetical protein NOV72_06230 [Caballeronia novacaledonica]